jgi:hypothetical protein
MDYVGCTRTVQGTPVGRTRKARSSKTERLGTRRRGSLAKGTPVERNGMSSVDRQYNVSGHTVKQYGLVVQRYENLPRLTNCEMQARIRSCSYSGICKLWEHGCGTLEHCSSVL